MRKVIFIPIVFGLFLFTIIPVAFGAQTINLNTTISLTSGEVKILSLSPLKIEARLKDGQTDLQPLLDLLRDLQIVPPHTLEKIAIQEVAVKDLYLDYTPEQLRIDAQEITYDQSTIRGLNLSYFPQTKDLELAATSATLTTLPVKLNEKWPQVNSIHIEKPHLVRTSSSLSLDFSSLTLNQSLFQQGKIRFALEEKFIDLKLQLAELDLKDMYSQALDIPSIRKATYTAYEKFDIKELTPQGILNIRNLAINGQLGKGETLGVSGQISGAGITLDFDLSQNEQQSLLIKELDLQLAGGDKQITFVLDKFHIASLKGGTADLTGRFSYPLHFKGLFLDVEITDLKWADFTVNAHLKRADHRQVFSTEISGPDFNLLTAGGLIWDGQRFDLDLKKLHLLGATPPPTNEPINLSFLREKTLKGKIFIEDLRLDHYSTENVQIGLDLKDDRCLLRATGYYCFCHVVINSVMMPEKGIFYDVEVRGHDTDLPLFIGCFTSELPVYLTGKMDFKLDASGGGLTPEELEKSVSGEMVVSIDDGQIIKLSHLDRRLKFILDILHVVQLSPSKLGDSLPYQKFYLECKITRQEITIPKYFMDSPVLNVVGEGRIGLEDKKLTLKGNILFKRFKKSFNLEQKFGEER